MKELHGKKEEDFAVTEDIRLIGIIVGNVVVKSGKILDVSQSGLIIGRLNLETGSTVSIRGRLDGNAVNLGGKLEVFGTVNGRIEKKGGSTIIHDEAVVRE